MIKKRVCISQQISEKWTNRFQQITYIPKIKLSLLQINKKLVKFENIKSILSQKKGQLLGGGNCCSNQGVTESDFKQIKETKKTSINNDKNIEFENEYKKWINSETASQSIKGDTQLQFQKRMLKQCIVDQIIFSDDQIKTYSQEIQCIFETHLMLEATRFTNKSNNQQEEFSKIIEDIKSIESYEEDFPIMELLFYIDILSNLNKLNHTFDESEQKEIIKIKGLVEAILNYNKNPNFSSITSQISQIKSILHLFDKKKELFALKYQVEIWLRKIEQFGDQFRMISLEQEILFYVEFFLEINQKPNLYDYIILTLIRINFILENFQKQKSHLNDKTQHLNQQFRDHLIKANIELFLNELMQKSEMFNNQVFLVFSVENENYRYLTLSILLTINSILTNDFSNIQNNEYNIDFLCNKYLTEKKLPIRVIFEKSHQFAKYFNQNIIIESFKQKMIKFDQKRKEMLQPHVKSLENHERFINSFDDIIKLISDNAIQKWERDIKKRQRSNIAQKDDALLEVRDLYINQMITYLNGNPIFQKSKQNNNQENGYPILQQQNALSDILKYFLKTGNSKKLKNIINQSGQNDDKIRQNQCQILGILAEGGTGKSMLMKKIETLLIENLTKLDAQTENGNYLPIMVKCNSLDSKKPSLDEYLEKQGINQDMLKNLKSNDRNKLILLDGYDEYTGDYFSVYSTLKMEEWKNTKIIVSTRKEKLSEKDACIYFSKQNELGQIDEMSYTLVRLEEFTLKDIFDYAERYFKQERKDDIIKQEKDFKNLRDCLTNSELEKLLHLPINLYLFTRMIVNIDEKEIQELKNKVSDQIGIQEIFLSDQFEREAQSFIDAYIHSIDLKKDKSFRTSIKNSYFEYFQTIGMQMFQNRGAIQGNYLQVERSNIHFNIPKSVTQVLIQSSLINSLIDKIKSYINSKIITRVKSEHQQNINELDDQQQKFIEFKHKSLYEYFVARSMKNDFDIHEENIYNLKLEELEQFKINKKCIMNAGSNQSEQQILIKLYKLIKHQVECSEFYQNYYESQIEKNNRYIQYLKRSQIQRNSEVSKIDIGASNLISALFLSKFSYSKLNLTLFSFSKAYISTHKSFEINFDRCNLQHAFLQNSKINFDSCYTQSASFDAFSQAFDTSNIYSFNKIFWGKNNFLFSLSKSGFINTFELTNQGIKLFKSKQLSQSSLNNIQFINNNQVLVSSQYSLFIINLKNFEIDQTYKFVQPISSITLIEEENIVVALENKELFKGTIKGGFKQIKNIGSVYGCAYNKNNQTLVTYENETFSLWSSKKNFEFIKTVEGHTDRIGCADFSVDGKYLVTGSSDNTCKIWNAEKGFELINTIQGHTDYVYSLAFSADGKYLVTGSSDHTFKIWNAEKGFELINTIQGHTESVNSVAFSADGKYLATSSLDNTCKIWNAEKGFELINTIQGHSSGINSVAFSADRKYLATGSQDKTCKIWNAEKGFELINTIQGHTSGINSVAFSADGKYLATGSRDNSCKIWNVENGFELITTIQGHTNSVNSVTFSADGKYLATGSWDNTCKIWNAEKGFELINTIQGHTSDINSVAFSADGKYLATGSSDNTCKIWNAEKGFELINTIQGHTDYVYSVAFSEDGKHIATGSWDKTCKIWNAEKGFELINTIQGHTHWIYSVTFSADGKYLATGSRDNTCKIWNAEKGFELINTIQGHNNWIYSVAFSTDGKYFATGSEDNTCKIWNAEKGFELINTIQGHTDSVYSVVFSTDGKYLATGSSDKTCKIWNSEKGFELINTIQGHTSGINSLAFSADGKYLATGSRDSTCKIWNAEKGFEYINIIQEHTDWINSVTFSADGKYLATGSRDNTCKIWNAEKNFEIINTIQGHNNWIYSVAFSADGKYLATGSSDHTCKIWNADKGFELINTIQGHTSDINSVAFSSDGKYLATGSSDNTCKIWNAEKGFELINTIQGHTHFIQSVAFSADGKYLATGSRDNTCKIWNAEKGFELINTIQRHTNWINSVTFSADGKYLANGSRDNTCKIWNAEKGFEIINKIQGHTSGINSLAFSEDGKYLATGSSDNTCKIWNADKGFELINTIQGHTSEINYVAFSADGKYLATGSSDKTCKIWDTEKYFQLKLSIDSICKIQFSRDKKYMFLEQVDHQCKIYDLSSLEIIRSGEETYEKVKEMYQFEQNQINYQKLNLFQNLYIL